MSARPLVATDRASLILQLVPYLIGHGEVSVVDAAEEFDVTPEQMREMVEKLTVIGLPGEGGFWQMANDLFDIDWDLLDEQDRIVITNAVGLERTPRLTAREAAALLAGLQLAASRASATAGSCRDCSRSSRAARRARPPTSSWRPRRSTTSVRPSRRRCAVASPSPSRIRRRMPPPRPARSTR